MKCPKCGYLGFESVDRCRNCGYDFSLTPTADLLELPLKITSVTPVTPVPSVTSPTSTAGEPERPPLDDLSFLDAAIPSEPVRLAGTAKPDVRRAAVAAPAPASASAELPLFGAAIPDDLPLITRPSPPRPPLAVRRATPEVPRLRSLPARGATLDLGLEPPARAAGR